MFRVVAYYTYGTGYEKEARNLLISLDRLDIPYHIEGIDSFGSWPHNCGYKPTFILEKMEQFPTENIVYLDCDAIVMQYPELFNQIPDEIGVHYREDRELLSGTLFFRNCPNSKLLLSAWIDEQKRHPETFDQQTLQTVLEDFPIQKFDLPPTYVQIFDSMAHTGDPIIRHMQASRKYRRLIHAS